MTIPTADVERFTSGHAIGVDVAAIERDLASLWRKASTSKTSVTRACSWNLVVHTTTDAELERAKALADALVSVVPSRTVVLNHRPNAVGKEVEAFVTANCKLMPGGGKMVCTEEITIEARGRGGDHLPSLLRALLVPDIPTAVLWADLPPNTAMVAELLGGVDRLVLDSTRAAELFRVEQLGTKATAKVADLNWLRGGTLRRAIAGAFDAPADSTMLFRLKRVVIDCAPDALSGAKLLIGWLGTRLSWSTPERVEKEAPAWMIDRQQGQVSVELNPIDGVMGLVGISFESDRGERVKISVSEHRATVETQVNTRIVPFAVHSDDELVIAALGSRGNDKLYQAALHRAVELER